MKTELVVTEYVGRLSDDDLRYLYVRFQQRLGGDLEEACNFMAKDQEVEKFLSSSNGSMDWFDRVDLCGETVDKEWNKRNL